MKYDLVDIIISTIDFIVLVIGVVFFTGIFSVTDSYIRFLYMLIDFYCCINIVKYIEGFIIFIKSKTINNVNLENNIYFE